MSECVSAFATRPVVLYTDTIGGAPVLKDNLWAVTTDELNEFEQQLSAMTKDRDEWKESCEDANTRFKAAEQQLAAMPKSKEEAETKVADYFDKWDKMRAIAESANAETAKYKRLLESAEQRIRESQEQNSLQIDLDKVVSNFLGWKLPKGFSPDAGISFTPRHSIGTPYEDDYEPVGTNLFSADQAKEMFIHCLSNSVNDATAYVAVPHHPIIPPSLEELQRENADLTRKLAEQQANNIFLREVFKRLFDVLDPTNYMDDCECDSDNGYICAGCKFVAMQEVRDYRKALFVINGDHTELNKLLSEARSQAVPEGWQPVPIIPTENGVQGMVNAGAIALKQHDDTPFMENRTGIAKFVYEAMLAAAPKVMEVDLWK